MSHDPMTTPYVRDESVRRLAVIDVMNFLHKSAQKSSVLTRPPEDTRDYLDALDLAAFMHFFLHRGFDVRAVVPRSARQRSRNGYLFDLFFAMGLIVYTEKVYDDLVIIKYAADRGGFIISCDKYRDCLKMNINNSEKYVIQNRVIQPLVKAFRNPREQEQPFTLNSTGDRVVNFIAELQAVSHNVLYSDPTSHDYETCVMNRRLFTHQRSIRIRQQLDDIYDFVARVSPLPDGEYVKEIVLYKDKVVDEWGAPTYLKSIDEVNMDRARKNAPLFP